MSLGGVYHDLRRFDEAIDCFEQSMMIYRQQGDRRREATMSVEISKTLSAAGNRAAARARYEEALAVFTELGVPEADNVRALLGFLDAFPS
jgi:tetratricopeptide (TPR) repeat protein